MSDFLYKPNYTITDEILNLVAQIPARVDVLTIQSGMEQNPKLRHANRSPRRQTHAGRNIGEER
jgi:hypothetical protein